MFFGHPNFSAWFNSKLLTTYARKRFKLTDTEQREAYIQAHFDSATQQWQLPVDLKRVSFTNLSMYYTDYSVFKYLLETELDVLQQAPYNQITIYPEIIESDFPEARIANINDDAFIVWISTAAIKTISDKFFISECVSQILEPLENLSKINVTFLKSFAMELAVKHHIYQEYAKIFNQHPAVKNTLTILDEHKNLKTTDKHLALAQDFIKDEIEKRTETMLESDFFADINKQTLRQEMQQFCDEVMKVNASVD